MDIMIVIVQGVAAKGQLSRMVNVQIVLVSREVLGQFVEDAEITTIAVSRQMGNVRIARAKTLNQLIV